MAKMSKPTVSRERNFVSDDRFSLREDLVVEEIDDEFLILDLNRNTYFGLNGVARQIWKDIKDHRSFEQIVLNICEKYGISREQAAGDAHEFIHDILVQNLATVESR